MAYCMYLRKSRKDAEAEARGEGETLTRHKKILLDLAKKMNIIISEIYQEVVSGDSIASRPEVQRLLKDVESGIWEGVLVVEVERLARGDTSDQGIVSKAFTYSNTLIVTPIKIYDPTNEFDQEYFEFNLFMSRREYKTIKRRMHQGMIASCKEGNYIHNVPPYGYDRVKNNKSKGYRLEPKPGEAEIVKLIFEWFTKGEGQTSGTMNPLGMPTICDKLNNEYSQKPKSGIWTVATISSMLRNEHYMGYIIYGKKARKKILENGMLVDKWQNHSDGSYQLFPGKHSALISKETFELAQERLANNPKRPSREITNPLAGVIKCGICGRSMYRRPYQKKGQPASLICTEKTCNNVSSALYLVEDSLLKSIENWVHGYEVQAKTQKPDTTILDSKIALLAESEKKLSELHAKIEKIYESYESRIYDTDTFLTRQKLTAVKISNEEQTIANLKTEIEKERLYLVNQEQIIPKARKLLDIYRKSDDVQLKNDLMKEVFEKVVYTKTANGHYKNQRQDDFKLDIYPKLPKIF